MLAEASATLSAGEGCEGVKSLSTQKVATADTKAYSKINSDDKVAMLTARNTMKEGTQDIDFHARGTDALTKSVESFGRLGGRHRGALWQRFEHAHGHAHLHDQDVFLAGKGLPRSAPLRPRVRSEEERLEVRRAWQRRPGAGEH